MTEFRRSFKRTTTSSDDGTTNQVVPILNNCNTSSSGGTNTSGIIIGTATANTLTSGGGQIVSGKSMGSGRKTPLLKRINSQSNSGSSTTSTIGGGGSISGTNRDINYCEVYYLSPSKRKSKENLYYPTSTSSLQRQQNIVENNKYTTKIQSHSKQQTQLQINPVQQHFQSELNWSSGAINAGVTNQKYNRRDRIKSHTPENVFGFGGGVSRNAIGIVSDPNLDNFDICSHYSDSIAVVTKNHSSGRQLIQPPLLRSDSSGGNIRTNNVTFSNCTGNGSSMIEERIHRQGSIKQHHQQQQQQQIHSNRGSLKRSKGRSNQSLCSCDAGETTDITLDPNRPLYQYSLDRKKKSHTYTCEQNAQILMRLEREKNYKICKNNKTGLIGKLLDKQGNELNYNQNEICDETSFDYPDLNNDIENDLTTDVDIIPPPPPPPVSLNRKQQLSLKQDLLASTTTASSAIASSSSATNNNNNNNCLKSSTSIGNLGNLGESMLNDCTSTILNCANVGQIVLTGNTSTTASTKKQPDLCQMNCNNSIKLSNKLGLSTVTLLQQHQQQNDNNNYNKNIITNKNHHNIQLNQDNNIPLTPYPYIRDDSYIPCFKSKTSNNDESSVFFYHQESPQYAPNFDNHHNRLFNHINNNNNNRNNHHHISGKYNTIGPSSCYAKQLANYHQQQHHQQQYHHPNATCNYTSQLQNDYSNRFGDNNTSGNLSNNGRYFSQSLTNFTFTGADNNDNLCNLNDRINHSHGHLNDYNWQNHFRKQHHQHHHDNIINDSTMPYTQFRTTPTSNMNGGLSCSFGDSTILNSSSFTTIGSSNSGLKGKDHQMNQQQQQSISNSRSISSFMPWKHRQCLSRGSSSSGSNSLSFDLAKHWLAVSSILLIIGAASVAVPLALRVAASAPFEERLQIATQLLDSVPLIDGHNDLPWNIRKFLHNKLNDFNFDEDLRNVMPWARSHWSHTDLQRLKNGRVSAQFWAAYVPCEAQHRDAVQLTLEQIDVIKRLTERYSPQLTTCTSASDIIEAHKGHKLCSLTGVEGGHSLGGSLAVLRTLYAIGVRYMTLTSTCHTPWADSSYADAPTFNVKHGGLTPFGKTIIREMNRLGMIVDLSHVSTGTMRDSLATTEAPVIFSHSSAYELCNSSRNVQDDILLALAKNGGLVMVNFYSKFLSCTENSTVHDAVAHINHIRRVAGIDHVGLGAGFDGINFTPKGLEDVSSYPTLFAELLGEGWSIDELKKLAGENFLRVMTEVETIRDEKKKAGIRPYEDHPNFRTEDPYNCTSS